MMFKKWVLSIVSVWVALIATQFSGCASGGYKLTRKYSQWVNSNHIIIRVIVFLVTMPLYGILLLIDAVIFNTIDFWTGTVAKGTYEFNKGDKTYVVTHDIKDGLRNSLIKITNADKTQNTIEIRETATHEIEMYRDGQIQAKASSLNALPLITQYKEDGKTIASQDYIFTQFSKLAGK